MIMMKQTYKFDNVALKAARNRLGFRSPGEFAAVIGMTEQTVRSWESGKRPIPHNLPMTLGFLFWKETIINQIADSVASTIELKLSSEQILSSELPLPVLHQMLAAIGHGENPGENPRNHFDQVQRKLEIYRRTAMQEFINKNRELFLGLSAADMYQVELEIYKKISKLLADRISSDFPQELDETAAKEIKAAKV